ncbi:hypothetical protein BHM03_00052216, partial [Ensete ventricosum]
ALIGFRIRDGLTDRNRKGWIKRTILGRTGTKWAGLHTALGDWLALPSPNYNNGTKSRTPRPQLWREELATDGVFPMDEKAKRTRELLASFYSTDPSAGGGAGVGAAVSPRKMASPDSINSLSFDPDVYMSLLVPDPSSASPLPLSLGSLAPRPV